MTYLFYETHGLVNLSPALFHHLHRRSYRGAAGPNRRKALAAEPVCPYGDVDPGDVGPDLAASAGGQGCHRRVAMGAPDARL